MEERNMESEDLDDSSDIECNVCKVKFSGIKPYESHLKGKKHYKMVKKSEMMKKFRPSVGVGNSSDTEKNDVTNGFDDSLYESLANLKPYAKCEVCTKAFTGPESYRQHMIGLAHKKKAALSKLNKETLEHVDKYPGHVTFADKLEDPDALGRYFADCKICEKSFNNAVSLQQHMLSNAHSRRLREEEKEGEMKSYRVDPVGEDDGKFMCQSCDMTFNNVNSLELHLQSNNHFKQKQKKSLHKALSKYPELKLVSSPTFKVVQESGSSDDGPIYYSLESAADMYLCEICHCCFTGPESAKEHALSKKHAKAKLLSESPGQAKTSPESNGDLADSPGNSEVQGITEASPKTSAESGDGGTSKPANTPGVSSTPSAHVDPFSGRGKREEDFEIL